MDTVTSDRPPLPPIAGNQPQETASKPSLTPLQLAKHNLVRWFRELTIERRILAGFSLVFIGILIIGAISYRNTAILIENSRLDTKSHDLLQLLNNVDMAMDEAENNHRRYLVTGEVVYLQSFRSLTEQKPTYLKYLKDLTAESPLQEARVDQLQTLIEQQINAETGAIAKRDGGGFEAVRRIALEGAAKRELAGIHRIISEMEVDERQSLRRRLGESTLSTTNTIALLALGAVLQLVLLASVYYLIRHDITARRKVAAELQLRGELLEAANKELEAFSYSVSHDLRAPLRHIDGYASLLSKAVGDSLNDKAKRYLQTISDSAKQMGQLIDDLLVFSRMGRQEMLHTTVNLDQLIKTILYDLRLDLQGREISWTIDTLPEVPGDPAMLRQVFVNLISNAIKFTSTRPIAKIVIGLERKSAGEITVFVRDNGVGFDMQYLGKLFGVFQRLHRADEFEGTGIGLANVRRIVHRHGGRVWAEGIPDQGATFFVTLPTRRPRT
ncbi:MAG: ATP-binding protein [Nitrospira sp.]